MGDARILLFFEEFPDQDGDVPVSEEAALPSEDGSEGASSLEEEEEGILETGEAGSEDGFEAEAVPLVPVVVDFPDDYLDTATFNEGVESILAVVTPPPEEDEIAVYAADVRAAAPFFPSTAVYLDYAGQQVLFPSDYSDDLYLLGDELYNAGASVTVGMDLRGSTSVSRYVISEVTIPTYNSATYWQYMNTYGRPYRIVDRYISTSGSYTSVTRSSSGALDFSSSELSSYRGFGRVDLTFFAMGFLVLALLLVSRFRRV